MEDEVSFGLILVIYALMKKQLIYLLVIIICGVVLFFHFKPNTTFRDSTQDTIQANNTNITDTAKAINDKKISVKDSMPGTIVTGKITRDSIVNFAQTLIGTPYLYASIDPQKGFDCSGFITYVFNHYKINVPRSSYDFDNVGTTISLAESKKGDIILFTGTDSSEKKIGHIGIILSNDTGNLQFIHSTSGKAYGVTVTPFNDYYKGRFMKVVRVFK